MKNRRRIGLILIAGVFLPLPACSRGGTPAKTRDATADQPSQGGGDGSGGGGAAGVSGTGGVATGGSPSGGIMSGTGGFTATGGLKPTGGVTAAGGIGIGDAGAGGAGASGGTIGTGGFGMGGDARPDAGCAPGWTLCCGQCLSPMAGICAPCPAGDAGPAGGSPSTGGGGGGTSSGGGTGGVAVSCSATAVPTVAPVAVAATLSCQGAIDHVSVAAGTGTNGYVTLGATSGLQPSFFFDIGASAATVEQILPDAWEIHMVSNAKGVLGVVETSRSSGTTLWLTRTLPGGTPTWVSSTVTDIMWHPGGSSIEAALGPDGSQYAAFWISPNMDFALATRPPGGSAFSTATLAPSGTVGQNVLGVDANGAVHLMYWAAGQGLVDSQPGKALVTALASTSSTSPISMQGVRPSGQGIAMAMSLADGVHVVRPRADGAFDDIRIPATTPLSGGLPMMLIPCESFLCPTVTQSGDFSWGHALAQAGDGTLWLATVRDHVDRTATYERAGPGDACQCWGNFVPQDDRSSSTLVIQRIPSGATAPSGILWSLDLGLGPWADYSVTNETMSASFAGSLLFLAIIAPDNDVHYLVLDTANLK